MDFADVVGRRRMVRAFRADPVSRDVIDRCVALATRSPSAGKSQGWNLVVLEGDETERYWSISLPVALRSSFAFPGLLRAPFLALVTADQTAYLDRYSEPDKSSTGLGASLEAWPAPYWTIDASFATMTLLLAMENEGLGALFFAHSAEQAIRDEFDIPSHVQILGVIAAGVADNGHERPGRSAARPRRSPDEVVRRGRW